MGSHVEFNEMKSPQSSTVTSKHDIEVTREVDVDTYTLHGRDEQKWDQPWRTRRYL